MRPLILHVTVEEEEWDPDYGGRWFWVLKLNEFEVARSDHVGYSSRPEEGELWAASVLRDALRPSGPLAS